MYVRLFIYFFSYEDIKPKWGINLTDTVSWLLGWQRRISYPIKTIMISFFLGTVSFLRRRLYFILKVKRSKGAPIKGKNFPRMYPSVTFKKRDIKFEISEEVVIVKFPAQNRYRKIPEKKTIKSSLIKIEKIKMMKKSEIERSIFNLINERSTFIMSLWIFIRALHYYVEYLIDFYYKSFDKKNLVTMSIISNYHLPQI